jgi:hypothetical protein|tara:strand:- start:5081 stop:5545 length:465 start_codon:yes stop_codon:yes gene_type:complete
MATYDWAMCDKNTGNIQYIMSVNNNSDYSQAGFYGEYRTFEIASDADHVKAVEESYYDYDSNLFLPRNKRPTPYYMWTTNKRWEVDTVTLMAALNQERTEKLYASDWTQAADSPLTDAKKAEWATHRQALRDVPQNLAEDFDNLVGFAWPTPPS